jgi:hypothetical protein
MGNDVEFPEFHHFGELHGIVDVIFYAIAVPPRFIRQSVTDVVDRYALEVIAQ